MIKSLSWYDISWTSTMDGPGTRVVLYLSGCRLRCPWCHSPHTWEQIPRLMFFKDRCLLCGECKKVCSNGVHEIIDSHHDIKRYLCKGCGDCVEVCPTVVRGNRMSGALALTTTWTGPDELFKKLESQLDLVKCVGGLTISGGEPLLQYGQLKKLLKNCGASGIHRAVETSGSVPKLCFEELLDHVDCWLFGLRPVFGKECGEKLTADMKSVKVNIRFLAHANKGRVIVRTPLIPGYTNNNRTFKAIAGLMSDCGLGEIELLPFNRHSNHYYDAMGLTLPFNSNSILSEKDAKTACFFFEEHGIETSIIY